MKLIKQEKIDMQVDNQYIWSFDVPENGIYIISISARCKNWLQNYKRLFNDDDLAIQIDDYLFAEIKGKKREFTSPGSWNGNKIKNNTKNVLFILPLKANVHQIKFWIDGQPTLEKIKIYKIEENEINLMADNIVAPGKFLDIISQNLKIKKLGIKVRVGINSKLEIKIDGRTEKNPKYKKFEKWYWYGQELKGNSKEYTMSDIWNGGLHSLELNGQGKPEIESIKLKINLENIIYSSGFVKLYKDIIIRDDVNLRSDYTNESESLLMLKDGEKVNIINERVLGKYIENLSEIWHEVIVRGTKGYVLSSYIEIEGQEREKIIDLIKEKCNQYNVDANIMLAIASRESHFKPFAKSGPGLSPMGIFQLSGDTRKRFGVEDSYDFYQNVAGGVQNYKDIEKRITGRGDILVKRLTAWHDGPTTTIRKINNKTFDYNKLSPETKSFIKNVLANLEKKNWYHIIYLPIVILFFASSLWVSHISPKIVDQYSTATVINYGFLMNYKPKINFHEFTSNFFSTFDDNKYNSRDYYSFVPNVFLNETNNQVDFLNSKKKIVGSLDVEQLNVDRNLGITDLVTSDLPNYTHISPVVLENPENVFYFGATDSEGCGASNCSWVFYRFDADKNKLKLISADIFGEITDLDIAPDLTRIAIVSESFGGFCNNHGDIKIFNTTTFVEQQPDWFLDDQFGSQTIKSLIWKNVDEIEFQAEYQSDCRTGEFLQTTWLYNLLEQKLIKVKSQTIERPMS
ncbi:MAG: transglycosylase SLT domain-containing protein [Candidatus Paceibacterota bacterium]